MKAVFERVPIPENGAFHLEVRQDPEFEFLWHHHPEVELTYIVSSRGRRFVGDHIDGYGAGDLVLLGADVPHTWCSLPEDRGQRHEAVVVQFPASLLAGLTARPAHRALRRLLERAALGLQFTGTTGREVGARMANLAERSLLQQVGELFLLLDRLGAAPEGEWRLLSSRSFTPTFGPDGSHPIDRVCRFLNERYTERVPLARVARLAGLSPGAFSRSFHRSTGKTLTAYVTELRLVHACQLLMETDRSIADIASAAGFTNLSNFNRRFLATKGVRPRDYRAEIKRFRRK